jgi:octaprenyl-diphosphate synthase
VSKAINQIKQPVAEHMLAFEEKFKDAMKSSVPLLDKITNYIVKRKGKQIRPLFVFLSAQNAGKINESTYRAAALIELLHTATLVHDDVVDDSNERRGFFSINALWKNKIAVLVGDYLLSRGLLLSVEHGDFDLLKITSTAVREMSEGELMQMEKARRLDIKEEMYFNIIRQKTASLIASCCASGACSAGASTEQVEHMRLLGETIGIAFQIKDDLFDYELTNKTGKPSGADIKERKMTLPLINALQNASAADKKRIINIVKNNNNDPKKVAEVIDFVLHSGGMQYALAKMNEYRDKAIAMLQTIPESEYKKSFIELINFTTERES